MPKQYLLLFIFQLLTVASLKAQTAIPLSTFVIQDFNSIGVSTTASLPTNWKASSPGAGLTSGWTTGSNVTATTQAANSGASITGGFYNWATNPGTDRALGFMTSGSYPSPNSIMAYYRNTTGSTVTSITVSFQIERYRINTDPFSLSLFSSTDGSAWTARNAGDISTGTFLTGASAYTFSSPQTLVRTVTITGLNIANNGDFYLRWVFTTGTNSQGIGLDDVRVFAGTATPLLSADLDDRISVDNGVANQANEGDQLRYTTRIKNSGTGDAANVQLSIPAPSNTTFVPGSVKTSALARDDNFATGFNTILSGSNVLSNDFGLPSLTVLSFGPVGGASSTVAGASGTTDNGGIIMVNADGSFIYTPPSGFTGNDRFAYIASSGTLPNNNAIVSIAVGTPATATSDTYTATGNVSINLNGAAGVLTNDNGSNRTIVAINGNTSLVGVPTTTTQGGNLTLNADGSFNYNPPAGYEGSDNFTYTIDNGFSSPSTITVTLNISGMIWFINNGAGAGGDGRLSSPFNSTTAFNSVNNGTGNNPAVGDNIFIYESNTNYIGSIVLLNNQKLIGQDATSSLTTIAGLTPPSYSAALPVTSSGNGVFTVLTTTAGGSNVVTLSNAGGSNRIQGLTIGDKTGVGITGSSFGTLTVADVSISGTGQALALTNGALNVTVNALSATSGSNAIALINTTGTLTATGGALSGSTGTTFNVNGGSVSITYPGSITQTNNASIITISGGHSGTITFQTGILSATAGSGLQFDNADGIYNFNGTTNLNGDDAGIDILNGSNGNFIFSSSTIITNPTGIAFNVDAGSPGVTFNGSITQNNAQRLVNINATTGNTITFQTGTLTGGSSSTGININAVNGNINFANLNLGTSVSRITNQAITINGGTGSYNLGVVNIFTNNVPGIVAANADGSLLVSSGEINTTAAVAGTNAPAINIDGPAGLTTLNIILTRVSANNSTNGLLVQDTDGSLTVNGIGTTAGSGGTISNITNRGASLVNATNVTLKNMNLTNVGTVNGADPSNPLSTCGGLENGLGGNAGCNAGIHIVNVTGVSLDRVVLNGGVQQGINGNNVTNFTLTNSSVLNFGNETREQGIQFRNLLGNSAIVNSTLTGNESSQLRVVNTSGTLTAFNVTGSTFSSSSTPNGTDGIQFEGSGTATMNINVQSSTMSNNAADGFFSSGTDNANVNITVTGCTIQNNGNAGVNVNIVSNANGKFTITNNPTMTGMAGNVININVGGPSSGTLQGIISGNNIGTPGVANSGSPGGGSGIRVVSNGSGNLIAAIRNNNIYGITFGAGIDVLARDGNSAINVTITGNLLDLLSPTTGSHGIVVASGAVSTDATSICADIGGAGVLANNVKNTVGSGLSVIRVRNRFNGTLFRLPGYGGPGTDTNAVIAYLTARNVTNSGNVTATISGTNSFSGGAVCTQPN